MKTHESPAVTPSSPARGVAARSLTAQAEAHRRPTAPGRARFGRYRMTSTGPLPPGWAMGMHPEHNVPYYYNSSTQTTQWHPPAALSAPEACAPAYAQPQFAPPAAAPQQPLPAAPLPYGQQQPPPSACGQPQNAFAYQQPQNAYAYQQQPPHGYQAAPNAYQQPNAYGAPPYGAQPPRYLPAPLQQLHAAGQG